MRYIYDGNLVVQERGANNSPQVSYTRGTDLSGTREGAGGIGGLLARTSNSELLTSGSAIPHSFYHADGNGNITCLITSNQLIAARYHYDPFGNILGMSGPLAEANLYRFSSKELHPQSGLVYYLYRFYDPSLQRWINRDPLGEGGFEVVRALPALPQLGGLKTYLFNENNPNRFIDANGLNAGVAISGGLGAYGLLCNSIIYLRANSVAKSLDKGECETWVPRCLNLLNAVVGFPPMGVQVCKDCDGKVTTTIVIFDVTGVFGGQTPSGA